MARRRLTLALVAVMAAGATAAHAAPAGKAKGKTRTVGVVSDYFDPATITVDQGDRVKWVWKGATLTGHDVNVESGPERFHSETQYAGSFTHAFRRSGTYKLYCTQHEDMVQTVKVRKRKRA